MLQTLRRIVFGFISALLALAVLLAAFGLYTVRRSFPQTKGELKLAGLEAPVDVYRDSFGIPHIYADTTHDLFFAEGYTHAQDRFWQMDYWRHLSSGRLSEMFGEGTTGPDKFLRTLGWARVAEQELKMLDPQDLNILQAYADGVNAYLADHGGSAISLEYAVLKLVNSDYKPEPWQPLNSLTWLKAMAWDLRGNLDDEIETAILLKTLTPERVAELYPSYPSENPVILPNFRMTGQALPVDQAQTRQANMDFLRSLSPTLSEAGNQLASLDAWFSPGTSGIGSNSWVIAGSHTATGQPLLANDPHLSEQIPAIWYEVGLHCREKTDACPFEVAGFSFAGLPGVIIGHTDRVAWGLTNVGPDVMDLYIEKINPQNPNQYEVNGEWKDMQILKETIQVGGGEPVELTIRYTRHGPVITETYLPDEFAQQAGIELPAQFAVALRWTALEPRTVFHAIVALGSGNNWEEFRAAAQNLAVPSQNLVFADVDGNIGYQTPGLIPIRKNGDGKLPVPGWTDEYEWGGYIPFEQLPNSYNPADGFIATANNPIVSPDYPYSISTDFDHGYRARRIVELIEAAPGPIDFAYIQTIQGDNKDLNAANLVPVLVQVSMDDNRLAQALELLKNWDFQDHMDSAPAALFASFWKHLLADTFNDELPEDSWPSGGARWFTVVHNLAQQPENLWWDNRSTPAVENRDQIFRQAFGEAVDEMESRLGKNSQSWKWGELHTTTFHNLTLGSSGPGVIRSLFNRGPFPTSGGSSIVNATSWLTTGDEDYQPYETAWLPSMRMIVDLSNLENSLTMFTTGESGHAYHPHYIDMADHWRKIEYHPMLWGQSQVEAQSVDHLRLVP